MKWLNELARGAPRALIRGLALVAIVLGLAGLLVVERHPELPVKLCELNWLLCPR